MGEGEVIGGPRLRHAALVAAVGYVMTFGVPYATLSILPRLVVANDAAKTSQNITAHQGLFVAAIFAFLICFIGDLLSAWGLYVLLKPVNASISMLAAWLRVVFATLGIAAVQNLVTAHRLLTRPAALAAIGRSQLDSQVHVAIGAFNSQFSFILILFGAYLVLLGFLIVRSGYVPKWLGIVLLIDGLYWLVVPSGRYVSPGFDVGRLFFVTFSELLLPLWLIGWGTRLREPAVPPPALMTISDR
jgi:hypothetical protein